MNIQDLLATTLSTYLVQLPLLLVWLVGIALTLTRWRQYPRVAPLTLAALLILLVRALVHPALNLWFLTQEGFSLQERGLLNGGLGLVSSLVAVLAWIMLLVALFRYRERGVA